MATSRSKERRAQETGTRDRLVAAMLYLSASRPIDEIKVEEVLKASDISVGSLYHHFDDFAHLQETAMVERYKELLEAGLVMVGAALDEATDFEDIQRRIAVAGMKYGALNTPQSRFERARILARAEHHARLREELAKAQQEVTDAMTQMLDRARSKGWISPQIDPRALAVFMQSYTFGRLVDDIAFEPMKQEDWQLLASTIFNEAILRDPGSSR